MDKKLTFPGGETLLNFDDLDRNNTANRLALFGIMKAFNIGTNENFIISCCVATLDAGVDVDVTAGYIFLNGEILEVDAQTVLDGGTADLYTYNKVVTYDPNGDKTFNDLTPRETWQKNRGVVTASTTPVLSTELAVVNGDRLYDKIVVQIATNSTEQFAAANIPNIDAAKIASGVLAAARVPGATETAVGGLEIATEAETQAGTNDARTVTPLKLRTHEGWITPSLNANFTQDGTDPLRYRKNNIGQVEFAGKFVTTGVTGTAFTLPVEYRPSKDRQIVYVDNSGPIFCTVNIDGDIDRGAGAWSGAADSEFNTILIID